MRFFLLAGVILTVGLSVAEAQEREFGAKIGPSFSSVSFDPDEGGDYDPRVSADGGGFAVFPMTSRLALQVEAMFTSKGAQAYDSELDLTSTILLQQLRHPRPRENHRSDVRFRLDSCVCGSVGGRAAERKEAAGHIRQHRRQSTVRR